MTRHDAIALTLVAATFGESGPLRELLYWLVLEGQIPMDRIVAIARRRFQIPEDVSWKTLLEVCPVLFQ